MKRIKLLILLGILIWESQGMAQQEAITKGVGWLKGTQNATGSFGDEEMIGLALIDTTAVLDTFYYLNETDTSYTKGIEWLGTQSVFSCSLLARAIKTLFEGDMGTSTLIDFLLAYQRDDGAFGGYGIENLDTTLVLYAFKSANYTNNTIIEPALFYLISNQNLDSGFGIAGKLSLADDSVKESNIYMTALAILTLNQYKNQFYLAPIIEKASNWLISQQKQDGILEPFGRQAWLIRQFRI